jgi:hypothetical protein
MEPTWNNTLDCSKSLTTLDEALKYANRLRYDYFVISNYPNAEVYKVWNERILDTKFMYSNIQ